MKINYLKWIFSNLNFFFLYLYFIVQYLLGMYISAICFILPFKTEEPSFSFCIAAFISSGMFLVTCLGLDVALEIMKLETIKRFKKLKLSVIS